MARTCCRQILRSRLEPKPGMSTPALSTSMAQMLLSGSALSRAPAQHPNQVWLLNAGSNLIEQLGPPLLLGSSAYMQAIPDVSSSLCFVITKLH